MGSKVPLVMLAAAGMLLARPAAAPAQRPPVQTERLLVLAPLPEDPGDSSVAVQIGDALRTKVEGKTRRRLTVISKDRIGEALEASGFGRDALLDLAASEQLARFLQADGYMVGWLGPNPDRTIHLRLIELRRSGLGGWVHYQAPPNATVEQIADALAERLDVHVRAAESTRECYERRDRRDFRGAKERARRAFEFVPNHPVAAMCLAVVFEVERAPADSQIAALELAVKGDSLNPRAWDMLGRQYQALASTRTDPEAAGADSLKGAEAFARQLDADPNDMRLRQGITALFITLKQYDRARGIIDEGLKQNPHDLTALQLKARACEDGSAWPCLVEALSAQYELDSTLTGNAEFYGKVIGAAQQANDRAALMRWTGEAVRRLPNNVAFWRARAAAFTEANMVDSALAAYRRISQLDSNDIAAPLRIAQLEVDSNRLRIDTLVQLDTAKLRRIDSILTRVLTLASTPAGQPRDTAVWMNVAVLYFQPATQLIQKRVNYDLGAQWLQKVLRYDVRKQLTAQANFFLGLAYFFPLPDFDAALRQAPEARKCQLVRQEAEMVANAKQALTAGASVQPSTANQLLAYISQFESLIPEYRRAFKC